MEILCHSTLTLSESRATGTSSKKADSIWDETEDMLQNNVNWKREWVSYATLAF